MTSLMSGKLESLNERVTANVAHEVPLARVDPPVDRQCVRSLEGFLADVALIRTRVAVRDQVAVVEVLRPEKFRTQFTLIKGLGRELFGGTYLSRNCFLLGRIHGLVFDRRRVLDRLRVLVRETLRYFVFLFHEMLRHHRYHRGRQS